MAIEAIALNIDGTLTNDAKVITPRTREALLAAQRSGIRPIRCCAHLSPRTCKSIGARCT